MKTKVIIISSLISLICLICPKANAQEKITAVKVDNSWITCYSTNYEKHFVYNTRTKSNAIFEGDFVSKDAIKKIDIKKEIVIYKKQYPYKEN